MKIELFLILSFFLFLLPINTHSQNTGYVVDSITQVGIPFVNIWNLNKNIGASSTETGIIKISADKGDTLSLSAVGYKVKKIKLDNIGDTIYLIKQAILLDEILVTNSNLNNIKRFGVINKKDIIHFFLDFKNPLMYAQYFPFDSIYSTTTYIKEINILTRSRVENAKFIVRLYKVGDDGLPGDFLYDKNIIIVAKKGKNITPIDLSDLRLKFPEEGFYLGLQTLDINVNYFKYKYKDIENIKRIVTGFSPDFGTFPTKESSKFYIYKTGGNWYEQFSYPNERQPKLYYKLATELILSD